MDSCFCPNVTQSDAERSCCCFSVVKRPEVAGQREICGQTVGLMSEFLEGTVRKSISSPPVGHSSPTSNGPAPLWCMAAALHFQPESRRSIKGFISREDERRSRGVCQTKAHGGQQYRSGLALKLERFILVYFSWRHILGRDGLSGY